MQEIKNQKSKIKKILNLRTTDHPRGKWIYDGDRPILFWYAAAFVADIVRFGPDEDAIGPVPEVPRVYDMVSYFNMHAMLRWAGPDGAYLPDKVEQHWTPRDDGGLQFEMLGTHDNGDHTRHTFDIGWDDAQQKYRYEFGADFWYREHRPMEFLNFYPRGACHSQASGRRYTHTVWKGLDGTWSSFPHNGVYTCMIVGPCRVKYLSRDQGQIGFGADADFNPMLTVLEATPAMELHTCSMWRDEHFVVMPGGLENREGGFYHTSARVRLENLPRAEMQSIMDSAEPVLITETEREQFSYPGFTIGEVSDFEESAPVDVPGYHSFWEYGREFPHVTWVEGKGHSGKRCLGVTGSSTGRIEVNARPVGAFPQPGMGKTCRLTAWVDTTDLRGEAWIALARIEYHATNVTNRAASARSPGGGTWCELTVEFDTGDQDLLLPELWVQGDGTACFDDVLMEIVD